MAIGRPKAELVLNEAEHAQLSSMARSRSVPAALVARARIAHPQKLSDVIQSSACTAQWEPRCCGKSIRLPCRPARALTEES